MPLAATAALLLLASAQQPPATAEAIDPDHPEILVEGQREDERKAKIAEDPYPMVERELLGSRIKRKTERRFRTVASNTGLAGLANSVNGTFDATGVRSNNRRERVVRECKSSYEKLSETTACELWTAERAMSEGRLADAEATIGKLMATRHMSAVDRYHVANYAYLLAEQKEDDAAKEAALATLFDTGMMPDDEKLKALKTMVRLKLKRDDQPGAITALEQLLAQTPDDAASQANLATLYAWEGLHDKALPRMQTAVSLVEQKGNTPPKSWTDYLRDHQRN